MSSFACCVSEQVTNVIFYYFRWWRRLGRLWRWQDGRRWPRTGQGRSTGTLLNHPSPPPLTTFTPHTKTRLSLLTKPRCYEKKIETYSNYLNLFTLNLLCTPAECLYTTFTHFGPEVKNCQPIFWKTISCSRHPPHMLHSKCWMNMLYKYQWRIMPKIHPCLLNCNY